MSLFWLAVNIHWGALLTVVVPAQIAVMRPLTQAQTLSFVLGLGALVALFVTPVAGALSDRAMHRRGRRRPFILVGTIIDCVGLAVMMAGVSRMSLTLYGAGFLVVQLGSNIATGAYAGFIPDLVPLGQRGEASGWMAAMTQFGTVIGALGGGVAMAHGAGMACYLGIMGAMLLLMVVTVLGVVEQPRTEAPPPTTWWRMLADMWVDPRRHTDFAWVWGSRFLAIFGIWMVQPYLLYYLRDVVQTDQPEIQTGIMMAIMLVGATVTGWLAGLGSDRLGRKVVVYAATGTLAVAILLLIVSRSLPFTLGVGLLFGLGYGAYYSVDWALACDVLPDQENAGRYLGVWNIAMVLPQSVAPILAGALLTQAGPGNVAGHYAPAGYAMVFVGSACVLAVAAVLIRPVRSVR